MDPHPSAALWDGLRGRRAVAVSGATPCIQSTMFFSSFVPGAVNRAGFGGKGQLFARAATTLVPGSATVVQFIGGDAGEFVCQQLDHVGISHADVATEGETRTCTTLISTDPSAQYGETELVGVAEPVSQKNIEDFLGRIEQVANSLDAERCGVAIVGTHPESCGKDFYASICRIKERHPNILVFMDSFRNVDSALATGTLKANARGLMSIAGCIDVLKINVTEFTALCSAHLPDMDSDSLSKRALALAAKFGLSIVALTDGPRPASIFARTGDAWAGWEFAMPAIALVNAIGAGDTAAAGFLLALLAGHAPVDAFRAGLAAGCASCTTDVAAGFDVATVLELYEKLQAKPITL